MEKERSQESAYHEVLGYPVDILRVQDGGVVSEPDLVRPNLLVPALHMEQDTSGDRAKLMLPEEYTDRLKEINQTFRVIADPQTGHRFEIAEVNTHLSQDEVDVEIATYRSSLSGNVGNAAEFAYHGVATPDRRRMYIASIGNGYTEPFTNKELNYFAKTGRMTWEDGGEVKALPTIEALQRALREDAQVRPTRFSTDSFGGNIASALMYTLENDQVSHVYMKGRPNVSQHAFPGMVYRMLVKENIINNRQNEASSQDPWKLTKEITEEVKAALPNIYEEGREIQLTNWRKPNNFKQLIQYGRGLGKGFQSKNQSGLDLVHAAERHPGAAITIDMPSRDELYRSPEDRRLFIAYIAGSVAVAENIQGVVSRGSHGGHTYNPGMRAALEQYAFKR